MEQIEELRRSNSAEDARMWEFSKSQVEQFLKASHDGDEAIASIFMSCIILAWTAFETLAGDLWESAINEKPKTLGLAALGKVEKTGDPHSAWMQTGKERMLSVPLRYLENNDFNLGRKLGTALKESYKFTGLGNIFRSYLAIWETKKPELTTLFLDKDIKALACVRNSLVHKGGIIDEEFVDKAKGDPRLDLLKCEDVVPLDGNMLEFCVGGASKQGVALLKFVDDWLQ